MNTSETGGDILDTVLVDTHAHVGLREFDGDRHEVVARARAAGIVCFVEVGFDFPSSVRSVELARELGVFAAVGIHPHDAGRDGDKWHSIEDLARRPEVVAVGEIGLDFYGRLSPKDTQVKCFIRGLELARRLSLPVIVHERDAGEEVVNILMKNDPGTPVIFHCFSGDRRSAKKRLDMGGYLGFGGLLTYPGRHELREALRYCPHDRILLETDCPYLPPQGIRGKRNEPSYLVYVLEQAARVLGVARESLANVSTLNACKALRLPEGLGT